MTQPPEKKEFTGQLITLNRPNLFAAKLPNSIRRPTLTAKLIFDNPRLVIKTGLEADVELPGRGEITAPMSSSCWRDIVDYIIPKVATLEPGKQFSIANKTPAKNAEGESDMRLPPVLVSTTRIGRDKEGICYITIESADESRPKIVFRTLPTHYHPIVGPDGKEFDPPLVSYLALRSFFKKIDDVFGPKLNEEWKPDPSMVGTNWKDRNKSASAPKPSTAYEPKFEDVDL